VEVKIEETHQEEVNLELIAHEERSRHRKPQASKRGKTHSGDAIDAEDDVAVEASDWVAPKSWSLAEQDKCWPDYYQVNSKFVETIVDVYQEGDIVWIQDYHLLLLPMMISRKLRGAKVGISLHVPFPSSEIFRTLANRDALLRGMLSADYVGFHTYESARHFLTSCKRVVGAPWRSNMGGYLPFFLSLPSFPPSPFPSFLPSPFPSFIYLSRW
jgi:hypothetical protein